MRMQRTGCQTGLQLQLYLPKQPMNRQQLAARTCEHVILAQRIGGASGSIRATSRRRRNESHLAPLFKLPLFKLLFVTGCCS